ncbi:MAG: hypothetical protein JXA22_10010 [Candidatus Thermoplasmatota archaeon]|nr:hypothetical protein [Candidatus Thermoplasmatota archaeon]
MRTESKIAVFLVGILVASVFVGIRTAEVEGKDGSFGGGSGTLADPYLIEDVDDLQKMKNDPTAHYALVRDIDASGTKGWNSGQGFQPVGSDDVMFGGSLDGRGHSIRGLFIDRGSATNLGLFGYIMGATLSDISLVDVNVTGYDNVGGLVGTCFGTVSGCSISGEVRGNDKIGGLIGFNGVANLSICYSVGSVSGRSEVGGFTGWNTGTVTDCYATGSVAGTSTHSGGFVGWNTGTMSRCYAAGSVTGADNVGGFVGSSSFGTVENCFWDMDTTGQTVSDGGEGMTTEDMMLSSTYYRWDLQNVWSIIDQETYPWLSSLTPFITTSILSPARSGTLVVGDALRFTARSIFGPDVEYKWDFSDGRGSTVQSPGLVRFPDTGTFGVGLTVLVDSKTLPGKDERTFVVVPVGAGHPDLDVVNVEMPDSMIPGGSATISYKARNVGDAPISGNSWLDAIYLSGDHYLDVEDSLLASVPVSVGIAEGATYTGSMDITIPILEEGAYHLIVSLNDGWAFPERHRSNNEDAEDLLIAIPELLEGEWYRSVYEAGKVEHYFRFNIPSGKSLTIALDGPEELDMIVRYGRLPTVLSNDGRSSSGKLMIPAPYSGNWFILIRSEKMVNEGNYSVVFWTSDIAIVEVFPSRHVSELPLELMLTGAGFIPPLSVDMIGSDGTLYRASNVEVHQPTMLSVSFSGGMLREGCYGIRVTRPDTAIAELPDVLEIVLVGGSKFDAELVLPDRIGYNSPATFYVEYSNTGDVSMPAPLLSVTGFQYPEDPATENVQQGAIMTLDPDRIFNGVWTDATPKGFSETVQFLASGQIPGILGPGESGRVPIFYAGWRSPWDLDLSPIEWVIGVLFADNDTRVDRDALKERMRIEYVREDAWDVIWSNFVDDSGDTWGDLVSLLDRNALYLHRQGQRVEDIDQLLTFSFRQADGFCPLPELVHDQDALVQGPGLSISFERNYLQPISRRFESGPMGRGWVHNWQYKLIEKDDGTVEISDMTGTPRIFHPDIRCTRRYLSQPGDPGELQELQQGGYRLKEKDGMIQVYLPDGKLDHCEDTNGNRISCTYSGDRLTRLTLGSGDFLELTYDSSGHITSVKDKVGRGASYTYSGDHLTSILANNGAATTYGYDLTPKSPSEHALTEVFLPLQSKIVIEYDGDGHLNSIFRKGGLEDLNFTYGPGMVKVTDEVGNTNRFHFDHWGRITSFENGLEEAYHFRFDGIGQMIGVMDPSGRSVEYTYDIDGDPVGIVDPMGSMYGIGYSRVNSRIVRTIDPDGIETGYDRDTRGNLIGIFYTDGSRETWSYDQYGDPITWTNRRGNTTSYSFDPGGRVTSITYADGSKAEYDYDDRGNLVRMEDWTGLTTFGYDGYDRMVRIDGPGLPWLEFTFDGANRRTSIMDHLGNRIEYGYDGSGRLDVLTEGAVEVVRYDHDSAGRLSTRTLEGGSYTDYEYDDAGRIATLSDHAPDHSTLSSFGYTYDRCGRRTGVQTDHGSWTYEYDENDQLTHAHFGSTDPGIPSQDLAFEYNRNGNRISTKVNGEKSEYEVNDLNQYIRVEDRTFTYDLDGDLVREEGPDGWTSYAYDDEKRLVATTRNGSICKFAYDGLGHLASVIENGSTTNIVIDPMGEGNVLCEYDEVYNLISRYIYGLGLVGLRSDSGESNYYLYDALGSTSGLIDVSGNVLNSYLYGPFGETILARETIGNPYRFVGEQGVRSGPFDLYHMRARYYSSDIGRFISPDPIGISGGDLNMYRYVSNSPTNFVDPTGTIWCKAGAKAFGSAGGIIGGGYQMYSGIGKIIMGAAIALSPFSGGLSLAIGAGLAAWGAFSTVSGAFCAWDNMEGLWAPTGPLGRIKRIPWLASDPNQKIGPSGQGDGHYVVEGVTLSYRVEFENMEDATAPAQIITVRDPLSEDLDWSTFELTQIGFGGKVLQLEEGTRSMEELIGYRYSDDEYYIDIAVLVQAGIDMETGEVYLDLISMDGDTGLLPPVDIGLLPPEDGTGRGQGSFSYIVHSREGIADGTEIRNIATIQFDHGLRIDTNQIDPLDKMKGTDPGREALVTIDADPPSSRVNGLPDKVSGTFEVSWGGSDGKGSGIASFDIFVSHNGDPWTLWLDDTTNVSAPYVGEEGHNYGFYSIAEDNVGHREEKPTAMEAEATVVRWTVPFANAGPDRTVEVGTMVVFDGSGSEDDIGITNYTWTVSGPVGPIVLYGIGPGYTFEEPGIYLVTLTIKNDGNLMDNDTMTLTVELADDDGGTSIRAIIILTGVLIAAISISVLILVILMIVLKGSKRRSGEEE